MPELRIRRTITDRKGTVERDELLKEHVASIADAKRRIAELQSIFPKSGYNEEDDYWWARDQDPNFRINLWFVEGSED